MSNISYSAKKLDIEGNTIKVYHEELTDNSLGSGNRQFDTYSISNLHGVSSKEQNMFVDFLGLLFAIVIFLGIIYGLMASLDVSSSKEITITLFVFFGLPAIFFGRGYKYFVEINTPSGAKSIYHSNDASEVNKIVEIITKIQNLKG